MEGEYASLALGRMDAPAFKEGPGWAMAHQFMQAKQAIKLQKCHPKCIKLAFLRSKIQKKSGAAPSRLWRLYHRALVSLIASGKFLCDNMIAV